MTDETGRTALAAAPHTPADVLAVWLRDLGAYIRTRIEDLDNESLAFRPDPGGNSIGVTIWHFTRWLDVIAHRVFVDGRVESELWHAGGWARETGYDPSGLGYRGLGVVTGYTIEEVDRIPALSAGALILYYDQVAGRLRELLRDMTTEQLHETAPGLGAERTRYSWLSVVLQGSFGHIGEVDALLAMRQRRRPESGGAGAGARPSP
ncbi:MAG TPA: DinB family protein [Candidatus Limnocylindrales bacterium]